MAWTEFYANANTGSNMNGGSNTTGPISYTNGGWNSGTGVFTPASGNPSSDGVTVGDFASVYNDGATTPVFIARVTAVSSTTITVSTTIKTGTAPSTNATARTIKVGGAWKGCNAADPFPFGSGAAPTSTLVNSSSNPVRINFKSGTTYAITTGISNANTDITYQGYTTTVGDGGKATIDGSTNAIVLLTHTGTRCIFKDLIFSNNGTTGTNDLVDCTGTFCHWVNCVFHDGRGVGLAAGAGNLVIGCEAYLCNKSATIGVAAFSVIFNVANAQWIDCIAHDNGTNTAGFSGSSGTTNMTLIRCIADTNSSHGVSGSGTARCIQCDFYNNGGSGISAAGATTNTAYALNCNFVKNTSDGVTGHATGTAPILVVNCGFGSGTQANGATTSGRTVTEIGSVTYASNVTPWIDPANGDFRINLAAAIGTGLQTFTETQASYTGSVGNPVIGACQVADYPAITNVKSGVSFANAAWTGTYILLIASIASILFSL